MSRPLRIQYAGAFYHVMNGGAERRTIFFDPLEDRGLFLAVLADAVRLWKIRIHAYSLMDNHYHLLVETPIPNLNKGSNWTSPDLVGPIRLNTADLTPPATSQSQHLGHNAAHWSSSASSCCWRARSVS